jgi:hypothetical protein
MSVAPESSDNHERPRDHAAVRAHIGRSKRLDAVFAVLGLGLVITAVALLGVLFGQLVRDGRHRLAGGHEVKASGYSPGMRDLVGVLVGKPDDLRLKRDTYRLADAEKVSKDLAALEGKAVVVAGDLPPAPPR